MNLLQDIQNEAKGLMLEHGLAEQGWHFRFDSAKRRSGCCNFSTRTISLSKAVYSIPANREVATNTILHEIAHALVGPKHDHDAVWRRKAKEIGCTGQRCSELVARPQGKYQGTCGCGVDFHHMHRMTRDRFGNLPKHRCNNCREQVIWRIAS